MAENIQGRTPIGFVGGGLRTAFEVGYSTRTRTPFALELLPGSAWHTTLLNMHFLAGEE